MGGFFMKEDIPLSLAEDSVLDKKRKHRSPCIVEGKRRKYQDGLAEQSAETGKRVLDNNVENWENIDCSTSSSTGCTKKLRRERGDEGSGYQLVKRRRVWRVQQDCVDRKRLRSDNDCDDDGGSRKKRRIEHGSGFTSAASAAWTRVHQASDNQNSTRRGKRPHNDRDVRIVERLASGTEDFGSRSKKQRVDGKSEQDTWRRRKRKREEENEDDDSVTGVMTDFVDGNAEIHPC